MGAAKTGLGGIALMIVPILAGVYGVIWIYVFLLKMSAICQKYLRENTGTEESGKPESRKTGESEYTGREGLRNRDIGGHEERRSVFPALTSLCISVYV